MSDPGHAFGIDIGGSGVKGAEVDLTTGELCYERIKIETPHPATPNAVAEAVAKLVAQSGWEGPVGITMPSVVLHGQIRTAANIDKTWVGIDARHLFSTTL